VHLGDNVVFNPFVLPVDYKSNETYTFEGPTGSEDVYILEVDPPIDLSMPSGDGLHRPSEITIRWLTDLLVVGVEGLGARV